MENGLLAKVSEAMPHLLLAIAYASHARRRGGGIHLHRCGVGGYNGQPGDAFHLHQSGPGGHNTFHV